MKNTPIPYIDYSLCAGCGACAELYPELFEIRDGLAWVINHEGLSTENVENIVTVCIYGAITIAGPASGVTSHNTPSSRGRGRGKR